MFTGRFRRFQVAGAILATVLCLAGTSVADDDVGSVTVTNNLKTDLAIAVFYTRLQDNGLGSFGWVNVKPGDSAKLEYTGSETEIYLHLESKGKEKRINVDDTKDILVIDSHFECRQSGDTTEQVWKWGDKLQNSVTVDMKKKERPDAWDARRFFNATKFRKINVNP